MLSSLVSKPLIQNPLAGGPSLTVPNPNVTTPRGGGQSPKLIDTSGVINPIGGSGGFLGDGSMEQVPIDPIMQGFQNSEFRKRANNMQQNAVYFKYKGKDMQMNSSMAGAFKQYLDSIGKGDLYESELSNAGPLQQIKGLGDNLAYQRRPNNPSDPIPSLNPDITPSFDLKQADPNNLISGYTPPTGGTLNGISTANFNASPPETFNTVGINSLTQNSMTSPYLNNNQDFDQYLNSYIENSINKRMRDIFGGIMSIFQ